jgi:hypothetical protein
MTEETLDYGHEDGRFSLSDVHFCDNLKPSFFFVTCAVHTWVESKACRYHYCSQIYPTPHVWNGRRIGRCQTPKSLARSVFLFARFWILWGNFFGPGLSGDWVCVHCILHLCRFFFLMQLAWFENGFVHFWTLGKLCRAMYQQCPDKTKFNMLHMLIWWCDSSGGQSFPTLLHAVAAPRSKEGNFECMSWPNKLFFGGEHRGFLKEGVKTYLLAPMAPLNSPIIFSSSNL